MPAVYPLNWFSVCGFLLGHNLDGHPMISACVVFIVLTNCSVVFDLILDCFEWEETEDDN